jgi:NAD(P)-dependent dehydrogenase (short-subunit alcohol dehydrogenase family)
MSYVPGMGQIVVVTGAVGNLGKAVAERMLAAGASLALIDRGADRLAPLFPSLVGSRDHLLLPGVDLDDLDAVQAAAVTVLERLGRMDALVHCAGGFAGSPFEASGDELWDAQFRLNVGTARHAIQAVLPAMRGRRSGRIVVVSSIGALAGAAGTSAYSASKAALLRLMESVAAEHGPHGVIANAVLPGSMDTPQNRKALPPEKHGELVPPESVAEVIAFLCSPALRGVNGAAIPVTAARTR